ncbi:MAG: phosphopyruvate hydratase [Candidatus Gracilibacteria bacterium]|nr:phosphopyruvate hydratase [Candidatus Gracilibacteria bacterium]
MSSKIKTVFAREILDSRGNPTVEVEMSDGKNTVLAKVPSGASTGAHEALELRDGEKTRFLGKGVQKAVLNVNNIIAPAVRGKWKPEQQKKLDAFLLELDGTENKSTLGANAILGVSLAAARLAAVQKGVPLWKHLQSLFGKGTSLPRPMMNVLNGGKHADSGLAIQEFMIFPNLGNFSDNLRAGAETFQHLKKILQKRGESTAVGDEGGVAPRLPKVADAFDVILEAITVAGYEGKVELAIDAAASEFYGPDNGAPEGKYLIDGQTLSAQELTDFYRELVAKYPIVSIEDSHAEDDFDGFADMQEKLGERLQLVGDDLLVTNKKRLEMGIEKKLCNAILIKVNQIGTLSETFETMHLAKKHDFGTVISHRSGETSDDFIADLAVGTDAGQIKTGSLSRSERIAKYNQLLRIEEQL